MDGVIMSILSSAPFLGQVGAATSGSSLYNFLGGPQAGLGLGIGSAIGGFFGQQAMNRVQDQAYQKALSGTQRSLQSLLGRGDLVGQNANARVVGRDTGGQTMYDRVLAPGTILSGGLGGGGIDPRQVQARIALGRLMSTDPFSGQQRAAMAGEQNRQLGQSLAMRPSGNLQQDLAGLLNYGGAGQAAAGMEMQLGQAAADARRQAALGAAQYLGSVYGAAGKAIG